MLGRKRCKQCGEHLRLFDKTDFCDHNCYSIYKQHELEYEEVKRKVENTLVDTYTYESAVIIYEKPRFYLVNCKYEENSKRFYGEFIIEDSLYEVFNFKSFKLLEGQILQLDLKKHNSFIKDQFSGQLKKVKLLSSKRENEHITVKVLLEF